VAEKPLVKPHPFYIGVTEMNYNAGEKSLEISTKLFAEDVEQILAKSYKTTIDFADEKQKVAIDKLLKDYLVKHLSFSINGKPTAVNYVGFEKEAEAVYCYLEISAVASLKKVDVNNTLLYDFIDQQINIMHVVVNGKRQSTKLSYPDRVASFSF
jgi:hypothetical protein